MNKTLVFMSLVLMSACAFTRSIDKKKSFTFDSVRHIFARALSQKQILTNYGEPNVQEKDGNKVRWRYLDPTTQFERVQFVFNESKALVQLIWIPLPGDRELKIERIFEHYPAGYFKATNKSGNSKHSLQTDTTYSGESVAILRDDVSKKVQAVAWFPKESKPSETQNPMTSR